jgi:hypothetical protein
MCSCFHVNKLTMCCQQHINDHKTNSINGKCMDRDFDISFCSLMVSIKMYYAPRLGILWALPRNMRLLPHIVLKKDANCAISFCIVFACIWEEGTNLLVATVNRFFGENNYCRFD